MSLRRDVLKAFKALHRARKTVFDGDDKTLREARLQINDEFKKSKAIKDISAIQELINHSRAVENELKSCVIQAEEVKPGKFEVKMRQEVVKLDNIPFKDVCEEKT